MVSEAIRKGQSMIRILRLMEYVYETNDRAQKDMERWEIPANGAKNFGGMVIKSSIITDLNHEADA